MQMPVLKADSRRGRPMFVGGEGRLWAVSQWSADRLWAFLNVWLLCGSIASAQRAKPVDDLIEELSGPSREMIAGVEDGGEGGHGGVGGGGGLEAGTA